MAPEHVDKGEISFKSDIYSLGVLIRKILMGRLESDSESVRSIYLIIFIILI